MDTQQFFREALGISDPELIAHMDMLGEMVLLQKDEVLFLQDEIPDRIALLAEGIMLGLAITENGREVVDCIAFRKGDAVMPSSNLQQASPVQMRALTPCKVFVFPIAALEQLVHRYPQALNFYTTQLTAAYERHWTMKMVIGQYRARERYEWFLKEFAPCASEIPIHYIASFLNIAPGSLSRIRREMLDEA